MIFDYVLVQAIDALALIWLMRALSSAGEHYIDIVGVTGSIPVVPTINQICYFLLLKLIFAFLGDPFRLVFLIAAS